MDSVILSAVRLPTGKFLGSLKDFTAPHLGALVVREAVRRAGIDPGVVDECIMGNVVSAGLGQAPARQAALRGGLSDHLSALTINKVCGSGLKAVMLGSQGIATGDASVVVAGGMESMSNAPYLLAKAREGLRMGHSQVLDSMINDLCSFEGWHMGNAGEVVATECGIGRQAQDAYAPKVIARPQRLPTPGASTRRSCPFRSRRKRASPSSSSTMNRFDVTRRSRHSASCHRLSRDLQTEATRRRSTTAPQHCHDIGRARKELGVTPLAAPSRKHRADSNRSTCS